MSEIEEPFFALKLKGPCPCKDDDCKAYGVIPKPGKHQKQCTCAPCGKGKNRDNGLKAQTQVAKAFKVKGVSTFHPGNEENWLSVVRIEAKSGPSECGPLMNFYRKVRKQSDAAKRVGDSRIFVGAGVIDDESVVVIRTKDIPQFIYDTGTALNYWDNA